MPNFAALRAAVFPLYTKNLRGADIRPPQSVRGLSVKLLSYQLKLCGLYKDTKLTSQEMTWKYIDLQIPQIPKILTHRAYTHLPPPLPILYSSVEPLKPVPPPQLATVRFHTSAERRKCVWLAPSIDLARFLPLAATRKERVKQYAGSNP